MRNLFITLCLVCSTTPLLSGCSSTPKEEDQTLGSLDISHQKTAQGDVFVKPKSEEEIKAAYYNYIKNAPANDNSRLNAMNRLTELEMNRVNDISKNSNSTNQASANDEQYYDTLRKSLTLMQTALREFPNAKGNDKTLYQLSRTHELLGEQDQSIAALETLTKKYQASPYYAEAQFRMGEVAFAAGNFADAEHAYTETVLSSAGDIFYERSLFKRGWSRYKQGYYTDAADDYVDALKNHNFAEYNSLSKSDKDQFDEYIRALGLAMANLKNTAAVQSYFADKADFKYADKAYSVISDIYLKQKRYADATDNLSQFIAANPNSPKVPLVKLKILSIWKVDEFKSHFLKEFESFYASYNPKSSYWAKYQNSSEQKEVFDALRNYCLLVANYYQENYLQTRQPDQFTQADTWYQHYLEHFTQHARQDKVYSYYGELLAAVSRNEEAIHYFELAAYDGEIVLNKEAAYATIDLSNKLVESSNSNSAWVDKHIRYSLISAQLYPNEARYHQVALHAAELAFNKEHYKEAIAIASTIPDGANEKILYNAKSIKGLSLLRQDQYKDSELIFAGLLEQHLDTTEQKKQRDNLAIAIYQQAQSDLKNQNTEAAIQGFARVAKAAPLAEIAPNSLYEAIAQSMKFQQWSNAISYIQDFQKLYPTHPLNKDATKQLSTAYLNSDQGVKAAQVFEKISSQDDNQDVKMAALWKAAELYESKNNIDEAIHSYQTYVNNYPRPYPQYLEAMFKLSQYYQQRSQKELLVPLQEKMVAADKDAPKTSKTPRTNFIAANALLSLAKIKQAQYADKRLVEPLAANLKAKKNLMQEAITLFGQASVYSDPLVTTESTFAIGSIYQDFSKALLNSERPKNLSGSELEQYNILLEDQSFPFEEKAIEFYEINLSHIKEGATNQWITKSYSQLSALSPARYNRKGKVSTYKDENI